MKQPGFSLVRILNFKAGNTMRKLNIILILLFFTTLKVAAQSPYDWFNGPAFWQRIVIDKTDTKPDFTNEDTVITLVSTRTMQRDSLRCIGEARDNNIVRYFFLYSSKGKWHLLEKENLSGIVALMPDINKDWVVYTEGMGKIFTNDADRGMQMAAQYGVNVLLLDYPSIRTDAGSLKNYKFAIRNARYAYNDLMQVLDNVKALKAAGRMGSGHLSLFFHSMGNNVVREIVKNNQLYRYNNEAWVDNLILNAPCVPRRKHKAWVEKIHFAKHIYINYNPEDGTLKWGRLAGFHQVLGEHLKGPLAGNAVYVNFNTLCMDGHSNFLWLYGRSKPMVAAKAYYGDILHGRPTDISDSRRFTASRHKGLGVDILP